MAVSILGRDSEAQVDVKSPLAGSELGPITKFSNVQCLLDWCFFLFLFYFSLLFFCYLFIYFLKKFSR